MHTNQAPRPGQGVFGRDEFTCQLCARTGGPRGAATLAVSRLVAPAAGGSDHSVNQLTVCTSCQTDLAEGTSLSTHSTYFARVRELIRRVTAAQGAAEGYLSCVRAHLETGDDAVDDAHRELELGCDRVAAALDDVRSLPDDERPYSTRLHEAYTACFDRWERWLETTRELLAGVDRLLRADRSGSYDCPECDAGVWLDDDFCHSCGVDFDGSAAVAADVRRIRRRLVRSAATRGR